MLLQITFQDKATQTDLDKENAIEKILNNMTLLGTNMTLLCTKVDSLDKELQQMKSQQHDYKHAS